MNKQAKREISYLDIGLFLVIFGLTIGQLILYSILGITGAVISMCIAIIGVILMITSDL